MIHKQWCVIVILSMVVCAALCVEGATAAGLGNPVTMLPKVSTHGEQMVYSLWYNDTGLFTYGPITQMLNYSYIRLTGGDPVTIQKIQTLLQQRIRQFLHPLGRTVQVQNLSFTVDYPEKLPSLFLYKNFGYGTAISGYNSGNYTTVPHRIVVNGLTGWFTLSRGVMIKFWPPKFTFFGHCSSINIIIH